MKVLFAVSECMPFCATGGLAEVSGSLPKELKKQGITVKVIMPLYRKIIQNYADKLIYVGKTTVKLAWRELYCGLFKTRLDGVDYYFVDNKYYFDRDQLYSHYDDGERFAFFSKSIFECMEMIKFYPDIIHSNDHQTALVNVYLDRLKSQGRFISTKSVFTIHNIEYQGQYDFSILGDVFDLGEEYHNILDNNGCINLMKGAILTCDLLTTVSPRYAREITTARYGKGLEYIINTNQNKLVGVLNGINIDFYNPATDEEITMNYDKDSLDKKKENKKALQKAFGLEQREEACVISIISRLVSHKGMDLVVDKLDEIMSLDTQVVILGIGEEYFENKFQFFSNKYRGRIAFIKAFNTSLAKQIYSSSDLFLMPSKTEPCGLSQMIACRYATLPIVNATGGLYDSIKDGENGFVFKWYDSNAMMDKIREAVYVYQDKEEREKRMLFACLSDFSWKHSSKQYINEYKKLIGE